MSFTGNRKPLRSLRRIKAAIESEVLKQSQQARKCNKHHSIYWLSKIEKEKKKRFSTRVHLRKKNQDSLAEAGGGGNTRSKNSL